MDPVLYLGNSWEESGGGLNYTLKYMVVAEGSWYKNLRILKHRFKLKLFLTSVINKT